MSADKANVDRAIIAANALLGLKVLLSNGINEEMQSQKLNQSRVSELSGISRPKISQILNGQFSNEFKAELLFEVLISLNPARNLLLDPAPKLLWEKTGDKLQNLKYKLASAICHVIDQEGYSVREAARAAGWADHKRTVKIKNGDLSESKLDSLYQMLLRLEPSYTIELSPIKEQEPALKSARPKSSKSSSEASV